MPLIHYIKATDNYGVIYLMTYGASKDAKVNTRSMTLFGGTWGGWVVLSN